MLRTLLLNADYRPISVISWQKGMILSFKGLPVIEYYEQPIKDTKGRDWLVPAIIITKRYVKNNPNEKVRLTKNNLFSRDDFTCQYCLTGYNKAELSCDHVIPLSRGGKHEWGNVVTACKHCNWWKGDKLLSETNLVLPRKPKEPLFSEIVTKVARSIPKEWRSYV